MLFSLIILIYEFSNPISSLENVTHVESDQATDRRDTLAKFIYANLFDWIVDQMNRKLAMGKEQKGRSINILDIYGFESFKVNLFVSFLKRTIILHRKIPCIQLDRPIPTFQRNSFEQFCINYANERLRQHVNRHLLKLEQEVSIS